MGNFSTFSQPRSLVVAPPVNRAGETDARRRAVKNCVFWPPSSAPRPGRRRLVAVASRRVVVAWKSWWWLTLDNERPGPSAPPCSQLAMHVALVVF